MEEKKLYTLLVYSENIAGILNQITAVFTRRQVNIESLNVSASSIEGVHKYTITAWSDEDQIEKITKHTSKNSFHKLQIKSTWFVLLSVMLCQVLSTRQVE